MTSFRPRAGFSALLTVLISLSATVASGQEINATISGTVKDASGAVLPGAQVVLLNEDTGVTPHGADRCGRTVFGPGAALGQLPVDGHQSRVSDRGSVWHRAVRRAGGRGGFQHGGRRRNPDLGSDR